ncbi:hypothetical protein IHE55_06460 [Streptomyces pactum]|uniref:Uncharacterized protein n=1 Tax=Streptomyces pactum TaxID=68249 RepID=A0ABS0NH04_9ACTN|nr:DUF6506 family protein [Streptomyces pactum]MBH5334465.1 hypothetical protein [Streptomyces pactum]
MTPVHWAFIHQTDGADPGRDSRTVVIGGCRVELVAVGTHDQAVPVARDLAARGVQLIELCGGFGAVWTARVIEAVEGRVPVGAVTYGAESLAGLRAVFP